MACLGVFAQSPYSPSISDPLTETWRWRLVENLTAKGVRCMTSDEDGNMWFGLNNGIIRYDGYNWSLYNDKHCLNTAVGVLKLASGNQLYAGSNRGLIKFENGNWTKLFPAADSASVPVTSITEGPGNTIYAGVDNGLIRIDSSGNIIIYTTPSFSETFRKAHPQATIVLFPDNVGFGQNLGRADEVFVQRTNEIWLFLSINNNGQRVRFNPSDTLDNQLLNVEVSDKLGNHTLTNRNKILDASDGSLWLINGFYKSGILRFRNNQWERIKLSDLFGGDELHTDIMELSDGSLWVGGLGKFFTYRNGEWQMHLTPELPIPSSRIIFYEAGNGQIWIAGIQSEVFYINYSTTQIKKLMGLNFQFMDHNSDSWFIAQNGDIVFNDDHKWLKYDTSHGLIDAPVRLLQTRGGRIWAAGSHQGIAATAYLDGNRWIRQIHDNLSWGIDPRSVFQDRQGNMWFGAAVDRQEQLGQISGVLQLRNPDSSPPDWKHHTSEQGIEQHNVYGIAQSPDGSIWVGGTNLLRLKAQRWNTIPNMEYFNEFVDIVHSNYNLWVGSRYYGLFRFDGNHWDHFTKAEGLSGNTIISIFEENPESVWVITDKDIAWYDGQSWSSGLFPAEFRMQREGGEIIVAKNGDIFINRALREWKRRAFPFSIPPQGVSQEFWTVRYQRDTMPPISQITVFNQKVDPAGNTFIAWEGNDHWEETPGNQISYSWRINGEEWTPFAPETSTVLTNLPGGNHTFELRARDLDGNIEPRPASVEFSVMPPIWKQPWFILLVISFLIIIGYYEFRLINRNRSLFKLNESLADTNQRLENKRQKIEEQKEKITQQKEELEKKTTSLEEKNNEIVIQRDQLKEMVEKVEELSNVKQRFFTNISHEFRTPLTLILGSIENLLKDQVGAENGKLNQTYDTIQRSSKRILRLINQILEIRKIETGRMELNITTGDIIAFAREIVALFNNQAQNQEINLNFVSEPKQLMVAFDHDKIEKVLFNLLSNAFKSTPAGGSISVAASVIKDGSHENETINNSIQFTISDTGHGISEQEKEHVFDRFYQASNPSYNQRISGSGIGLSYVKDLLTLHNGSIALSGTSAKGSTFIFQIPALPPSQVQQQSATGEYDPNAMISNDLRQEMELINQPGTIKTNNIENAEEPVTDANRLQVLVVEDEDELRQFICNILRTDFELLEAANGADGLKLALQHQPDLVITDVMMPVMNGIELCRQMKSHLALNHIPVVILTAQTAPENKLIGYQTGADAYVEKPFNMEFLRIRIQNLLQAQEKTREKVLRDLITQPGEISIHSDDDRMMEKLKDLLEENISNPDFDVESLSQEFSLSRFHFSRKIKQITGLSPKEIINSYRLKRAGQILQQNKLTVSEIAYMVGFDHPNSFSRAFKKYFNMTPTEYLSQN
jgi:signal transduction histidine kinase/DNA-binding response OmpR family regulator/ligand-binding sensor domain-containing protein